MEKYNKGFTLLELIIVTIVLGVLAAVAVPRYMGSVSNAEAAAEANTISSLREAVEQYATQKFLETGRYEYPRNPFDYVEIDNFTSMEWSEEGASALQIGSWIISPDWDGEDGIDDGMGPRDIAHKRRDGNIYWWSYYYGDLTELDADDRGANVGLFPENPVDWVQAEFDLFNDTDGDEGQWFANGERDTWFTGDLNPPGDGF